MNWPIYGQEIYEIHQGHMLSASPEQEATVQGHRLVPACVGAVHKIPAKFLVGLFDFFIPIAWSKVS